jgi:hypothetical protein
MLPMNAWYCPNCRSEVMTPFCPRCGERPIPPRDLSLRGIADRVLHALTSIDGRMLRTAWQLLRYPGHLTVAYANGSRKPFASPVQVFLLANVLFFAVQSLTATNVFGSSLASHLQHQDWSPLARQLIDRHLAATKGSLDQYAPLFDSANVLHAKSLVILMVLPFASLLPVVFLRSGRPMLAHVAFALHFYGFMMVLFSAAVLAAYVHVLWGGEGLASARVDNALSVLNFGACAIYLFLAIGPVYGVAGAWRTIRALLLAVAAGAIVLGYRFVLFLITLGLS